MQKKLTIVILTYNRKVELLRQLRSIERQGNFDQFKVIVSDNASSYDIQRDVISNLTPEFQKIVELFIRPVNVGGACNIALSFQLVDTPWMWMQSDDDPAVNGSIERILFDIEQYKDSCWLKYSVRESERYPFREVNSLVDLFNSFNGNYGQFVFMSTNVFSMEKIKPYIGKAPSYIHTCFSQQIPAMLSIKNDSSHAYILPDVLVDYTPGTPSYHIHYAMSNYCNLVCSNFDLTDKEFVAYKNLFALSYKSLYISLLEIEGKKQQREFYKKYMGYLVNIKDRICLSLMYHFPIIYKIWKSCQ